MKVWGLVRLDIKPTCIFLLAYSFSQSSKSSLITFLFSFVPYIFSFVPGLSFSVSMARNLNICYPPLFPVAPYLYKYVRYLGSLFFWIFAEIDVAMTTPGGNNITLVTSVSA